MPCSKVVNLDSNQLFLCFELVIFEHDAFKQGSSTMSPYASAIEYRSLNEDQRRCLETSFSWPFVLFLEYMVFNPKQFWREYQTAVYQETTAIRKQFDLVVIKMKEDPKDMKTKRKLASLGKQMKFQQVTLCSFSKLQSFVTLHAL